MNREDKNKALHEISNAISEIERIVRNGDIGATISIGLIVNQMGGSEDIASLIDEHNFEGGHSFHIEYWLLILSKLVIELSMEPES